MRRPADAVDVRPEASDVMTRIMRMRTTDLLAGGDPDLADVVREAHAGGGEILIVGCAPAHVAASSSTWRARATMVLSGRSDRLVLDLRGALTDGITITEARLRERLPR